MPSIRGGDSVGKLLTAVNETSSLIEQAQELLANFKGLDDKPADTGWELVVELQEVLDRMRKIWPPKPFLPRT